MDKTKVRSEERKESLPIDTKEKIEVEEENKVEALDTVIATFTVYDKATISKLRVRKEPSLDGEVIKILDEGARVEVVEELSDGWSRLIDGTFVMSKYLK